MSCVSCQGTGRVINTFSETKYGVQCLTCGFVESETQHDRTLNTVLTLEDGTEVCFTPDNVCAECGSDDLARVVMPSRTSFCTRCKAGRLALAEYKARAFRQDNALTDGEVKALEVRAEELGITASQLREVMWFWTGKKNFERLTKHEREVVFERLGLEVAA